MYLLLSYQINPTLLSNSILLWKQGGSSQYELKFKIVLVIFIASILEVISFEAFYFGMPPLNIFESQTCTWSLETIGSRGCRDGTFSIIDGNQSLLASRRTIPKKASSVDTLSPDLGFGKGRRAFRTGNISDGVCSRVTACFRPIK